MRKVFGLFSLLSALLLVACGGGGSKNDYTPPPSAKFTFTTADSSLTGYPGGQSVSTNVSVTRNGTTGPLALTVSGVPTGATAQTSGPGTTDSGSVTITPGTAAAGTYNLSVSLSDGQTSRVQVLKLVVGVSAVVGSATTGKLDLYMSTSFQPGDWNYQFFNNFPNAVTPLNDLGSQHINLQPVYGGVPQKTSTTWDFSMVDSVVNPVLNATDHSPLFQIAVAPSFMNDANGHLLPANFSQFADYSANLVKYYNTGGFTAVDGHHASTSAFPITYWGIFNEPNIQNLTPSEYTQLYNLTVPAMQAVDPTIKFVAIELSDWGSENTRYLPTFVNNVTAKVDVMATHFYSSCNQRDTDKQLFDIVPDFANRVSYLYAVMSPNPALANVPVWITENNVNADWDKGGGISVCNNTPFVLDTRGSSPYFTAWRPYMFSQMGKVGAKALYNWVFAGDAQYGEMNDQTGKPRLGYWVDHALAHYFPSPPGADLLQVSGTDDTEIETLAAKNPDGSVVIMVANRALANPTDNNGAGSPRTVALDIHQISNGTQAKLLTIDGTTDVNNGPSESTILIGPTVQLNFNGYGVAFLTLQ